MEERDHEKIEEGLSRLQLPPLDTTLDGEEDDAPEEEEEEDEEEEDPVMLGFVQKPSNSNILARHFFPSKAGGTPAWLDPVNIPNGNDSCCGICGNPLQFLIQVYAPIEGNDRAFHRTLFVFVCPSMACLNQDQVEQRKSPTEKICRSVKVFRCQLPRRNDFYSSDPPKHDGHDAPSSSGVALCSWCGTWKGGKICSGCKFARYCSRKHQIDHWRTGHAAACPQIQAMSGLGCQDNILVRAASTCLWPEFEMIDGEEGNLDFEELDEDVSQNAIVANQKTDTEFLRQFKDMEASKDQKHWASFQARLSRAPDQVLRSRHTTVCPRVLGCRIFANFLDDSKDTSSEEALRDNISSSAKNFISMRETPLTDGSLHQILGNLTVVYEDQQGIVDLGMQSHCGQGWKDNHRTLTFLNVQSVKDLDALSSRFCLNCFISSEYRMMLTHLIGAP